MKLNSILNESTSLLVLYKGISEWSGLQDWPEHRVGHAGHYTPGFLSTYHIGRVYSEPELTGQSDQAGMIVEVKINSKDVENRTKQFMRWCDQNGRKGDYDISMGYPPEWQKDNCIWTVCDSGSGHAGVRLGHKAHNCLDDASFVYCGVPTHYKVVAYYRNQEEWEQGQ